MSLYKERDILRRNHQTTRLGANFTCGACCRRVQCNMAEEQQSQSLGCHSALLHGPLATRMGWRTTVKSRLSQPIRSQHWLQSIRTKGLDVVPVYPKPDLSNLIWKENKNWKKDHIFMRIQTLHILFTYVLSECVVLQPGFVEKLKNPQRHNRYVFNWFINCSGCKISNQCSNSSHKREKRNM